MMKRPRIFLFICIAILVGSVFLNCAGKTKPESLEVLVGLQEKYEIFPEVPYVTIGDWVGRLDLYYPKNVTEPPPVLIYFHGGGWDGRTKDSAIFHILPYLDMGFAVLNVNYRLSQVSPAPSSVEDCRCALNWAIRHAEEYYFDSARIVLTGNSAGGHLALITGFVPNNSKFDGECISFGESNPGIFDTFRVAAIINWYGPTDVADLIDGANFREWAQRWVGPGPDRMEIARSVSPLNYIRADLPPVLSVHGDHDPLVPYDHAVRLHAALQHEGVPNKLITVRNGGHGGFGTEETLQLFMEIRRFLEKYRILGGE